MTRRVSGVLLLYEDQLRPNAQTLREHVEAFAAHSRFPWYPVNLWFGFPPGLDGLTFDACVFHYTLSPTGSWVTDPVRRFLAARPDLYRVAIFQDEFWFFQERARVLADLRVDCLYSRHKPQHVRGVYGRPLPVREFYYYLAGYVSDDLVGRAARSAKPAAARRIDVGYRGRRLPFYLGRASQEKGDIAEEFVARTAGRGLRLDIAVGETDRLYGPGWDAFLADCRAVLGVEGGVSVIDLDGRFRRLYEQLVAANPGLTFAEFQAAAGPDFAALEDRIDYRSVTPRHFEAAAFRTLQILFEGHYEGLLEPGRHYVALKKDFSNLDEVLAVLADPARVAAITDRAYADLIASGAYSYRGFVGQFDECLQAACSGRPEPGAPDPAVRAYLADWARFRARTLDFETVTAANPQIPRWRVWKARSLVADYQRRVVGRRTPAAGRDPAADDQAFWEQVERHLGRRVPVRPGYGPAVVPKARPRRVVARAAGRRLARVYWSLAVRAARKIVQKVTRFR